MQERVRRISEGNHDAERGSLDFSCNQIEIAVPSGGVFEGSFHIYAQTDSPVRGFVSASDLRMQCLTSEFTDRDSEIFYRFYGEDLDEGCVLKGSFFVVSSQGEYELPFTACTGQEEMMSSRGPIKNRNDFVFLAKDNWWEAVKLFYTTKFPEMLRREEPELLEAYRALSAHTGNGHNLEEFLVTAGWKQQVDFSLEQEELSAELSYSEEHRCVEVEVNILRSGWGYTSLQVKCEGVFLRPEKELLSDDDFLGNHCSLPVYIDTAFLRQGKNFGRVYLQDAHGEKELPVTVRFGEPEPGFRLKLNRKRAVLQLMELYQAFRLKLMGTDAWLKETGRLVERLISMDENAAEARLFQAQLLLTQERENEAGWVLDHAGELLEHQGLYHTTQWAYYLYLTTLLPHEEGYGEQIASEIQLIYRKNRRDWRAAWLLLYLPGEYEKSDAAKWSFLQKQFQQGCRSPILYLEGLLLLNNNPALLRKLEEFELQVLFYGARKDKLTGHLTEQVLYLAGKAKEYTPVLAGVLEYLYEKNPDERVLGALCTLLIKGGRIGKKYFDWYEKGVEAQLRITNLYEYYLMSLDVTQEPRLSRMVLMYYMYQNHPDYERSAYLYRYVLMHRAEYEDLYHNYRAKIERFVIDRIQKGQISPSLAALYEEFFTEAMVNRQTASSLARLLFAHQVTVKQPGVHRILVYQPGNLVPEEYVLQGGNTWISLYGEGNTVVLEDARGNRFLRSAGFTLEKLMDEQPYLTLLAGQNADCPGLDLWLAGEAQEEEISQERALRCERVIGGNQAAHELFQKCVLELLEYYQKLGDEKSLEACLEQISMEKLNRSGRRKVLQYLVQQGKYEDAWQQIDAYLPYFADSQTLQRLVDEMAEQKKEEKDRLLLAAATHLFREGKYSRPQLVYLSKYFRGTTGELQKIWRAVKEFEGDSPAFCQRILAQALFAGARGPWRDEIFRSYLAQGARAEVTVAVLAGYAQEYFVEERETAPFVFLQIHRLHRGGVQLHRVHKLAFLKYYGENPRQLDEELQVTAKDFLKELMEQGIYLNFFRKYKGCSDLLAEMQDRTILEYRSISAGRPLVKFRVLREDAPEGEYQSKYLRRACPGYYFEEFILFCGERVEYSIHEEVQRENYPGQEGVLQMEEMPLAEGSKYALLNEMLVSRRLGDTKRLEKQLDEYCRREFLNGKFFPLGKTPGKRG